jgi:Zn-finger nucleic acid-binding protein
MLMRSASEVAAMSCPVCKVPLAMSDRQGIEIDYCPQCRGVWLDRGELDKIIDRSVQPAAAPVPQPSPTPQYAPQPQSQHYGHKPYHKRKKHWLNEIFD